MTYKVSVVTPFHNVDMGMFQKAADSMRQQTIGFENVEWVIVAHNCEAKYMPLLTDMFKDDANVIVKELRNEAHTPSSPRNYGMQFITAPYLGFLDGDDSFTPNCLEEAIRNMKKTHSQVVCFRREYELENDRLNVLTEIVSWNQTFERIVVEHGNWDDDKMFSGIWGMVTSKLFDVRFLKSHAITFDEEVPYAEDMLFCVQAIANADYVCYLPQLIGYHYFINGGSLVQSEAKSGETLVAYARGFVKIFSSLQQYGIYADFTVLGLSLHLSAFMLASFNALTLEQRQEIKRLLGPFISQAKKLKLSKTVSEEFAEMSYTLPNEVIMNPEGGITDFIRSVNNGLRQMKAILKANKDTDYGQRYSFASLQTIEGYQHRVPLTDYNQYAHLIRLQTNIGETGILTAAKSERYISKMSGKLIPMTDEHLKPYGLAFAKQLKNRHSLLFVTGCPTVHITEDKAMVDSLESILIKNFVNNYYFSFPKTVLCPTMHSLFSFDGRRDTYAVMMEAIADREIDQIVALTTTDILEGFKTLEAHWPDMVETIRERDAARAEELMAALSAGMEGVAGRLWPSLLRTVAFGAGQQRPSTDQMRYYTKGIAHNHGTYFTAETMLAKASDDDSDRFKLITDNDFYEFIPLDSNADATPLLLGQTKEGEHYQVVVTNKAGLYRFKTTHTITILEKKYTEGVFVTID